MNWLRRLALDVGRTSLWFSNRNVTMSCLFSRNVDWGSICLSLRHTSCTIDCSLFIAFNRIHHKLIESHAPENKSQNEINFDSISFYKFNLHANDGTHACKLLRCVCWPRSCDHVQCDFLILFLSPNRRCRILFWMRSIGTRRAYGICKILKVYAQQPNNGTHVHELR